MGDLFRFELSRALDSIRFRLSIATGLAIAVFHFVTSVLPLVKWLDAWQGNPFLTPHSAYGHWIGMDSSTVWPVLLFMVLPLLAALPAVESYWYDRNSGYLNHIRLRCKLRQYKITKAAAVFVSAFLVTATPLAADFLLTSAVLPCVAPEPATMLYSLSDKNMFGAWFYQHPMLYTAAYILFDSVFIAVWTTLALSVSRWLNQRFLVTLIPFLMYLIAYFIGVWSEASALLSPIAFLLPFQPVAGLSPGIPCAILAGLLALLIVFYFTPWRSNDEI